MTTKDKAAAPEEPKNLPVVYDFGEDAGFGFEGVGKDDFLTPILDIVQDNSKEIKKKLIPGLEAGDLIIRALGEHFHPGDGIPFVPVSREKVFMIWKPVDKGGGIADRWDEHDPRALKEKAKQQFGKITLADGNDMIETYYVYGILLPPNGHPIRCVVPFASTKISAYKALVTKASGIRVDGKDKAGNPIKLQAPFFLHRYLLKTMLKEKGTQSWHTFQQLQFDGPNAEGARLNPLGDIYSDAKAFYQQIREGLIKVDATGAEPDVEPGAAGGQHDGGAGDLDNDIPFDGAPPF